MPSQASSVSPSVTATSTPSPTSSASASPGPGPGTGPSGSSNHHSSLYAPVNDFNGTEVATLLTLHYNKHAPHATLYKDERPGRTGASAGFVSAGSGAGSHGHRGQNNGNGNGNGHHTRGRDLLGELSRSLSGVRRRQ